MLAVAGTGGLVAAGPKTPVAPAAGPFGLSPNDSWDTFDADVSVQESFVDASGAATRPAPPAVTFRLERQLSKRGWRTSMTLLGSDPPTVHDAAGAVTLDTPFVVSRMEYDDDGTAPRLYDRTGALLHAPSAADRALFAPPGTLSAAAPATMAIDGHVPTPPVAAATRDWIAGLIATPDKAAARRQAIERRYGRSVARIGGLNRYVKTDHGATYEMLVTPDTCVPMEANIARSNALLSHVTMSYTPYAGGVLAREHMHGERATSATGTERAVTDVSLTHIALTKQVSR